MGEFLDLFEPPTQTITTNELFVRTFGQSMIDEETRFQNKVITDIPIIITEDDKVVCIPNTKEVKHIGACGMMGTSKSVFLNALMPWDYYLMGSRCIIINDYQHETFEWSLPTISKNYLMEEIHANEIGLPIVYIFPSTESSEVGSKDKRFPHMRITIPLREVIKNLENYFPLEATKKYITVLRDQLNNCSSMMEIRSVIDDEIDPQMRGMKGKILAIFENLFNNEMLNVSVPDAPAYLEYKDKDGNQYYNYTVLSLLRANFIPSIQTSDLCIYDYFSAYMTFIVDSIYHAQYNDVGDGEKTTPYFSKVNLNICIYADEITKLWKGHDGELIKSAMGRIGTNGRMARIGLRWATQNYMDVPDSIRGNTKYLIVSKCKDNKEVNKIEKDFAIPKELKDEMLKLEKDPENGLFQVIALTTEKFILYDLWDGKKTETSSPQKGFLIPPQARHKVPGVII